MQQIHPKVAASAAGAGVGYSVAVVIVWLFALHGFIIPPEVADAMGVIITASISFISGWLAPPAKDST